MSQAFLASVRSDRLDMCARTPEKAQTKLLSNLQVSLNKQVHGDTQLFHLLTAVSAGAAACMQNDNAREAKAHEHAQVRHHIQFASKAHPGKHAIDKMP